MVIALLKVLRKVSASTMFGRRLQMRHPAKKSRGEKFNTHFPSAGELNFAKKKEKNDKKKINFLSFRQTDLYPIFLIEV